ncbi:hypothetical protein L873DRAFT_1800184 [Choiromyces venosus 120613-1]|uniref:Uncharacterized protein n=1 Tax=Choiromyces venosus 120613-1 TaxID=1336337 RepID=A0A3N4JZ99_9PEZI|nr:hypothetical protein L873DRAFT_1800184 [Choiromyces venosus 120613-1]
MVRLLYNPPSASSSPTTTPVIEATISYPYSCTTALSGEGRFQARRSKESVAQHPSSFEERAAFRGRIFTNFCHSVQFSRPLPLV